MCLSCAQSKSSNNTQILGDFGIRRRGPASPDQALCAKTQSAQTRKIEASQTRSAKKLNADAHREHVAALQGKDPFFSHSLARVRLPKRQAGSGLAEGGSGLAQPLDTTIQVDGATSTRRGHSCPHRGVSRHAILLETSIPSFDRLPRQSRRSLRFTHMLEPPHLTHTKTPLWWKILGPLWTLIAPRRRFNALFCTSTQRSKTCCHTSFWCSSSSCWVSASS